MFFDKEKFDTIYHQIETLSEADKIEVHFCGDMSSYIRISNSRLHQDGVVNNVTLHFRAARDDKVVSVSTNNLQDEAIGEIVGKSNALLKAQSPNPWFAGFPKDTTKKLVFYNKDDEVPWDILIEKGHEIVAQCRKNSMDSYALLSSGKTFRYIRNSHGLEKYAANNDVVCDLVVLGAHDARGYAFDSANSLERIDFPAITEEAIRKCKASANPVDLQPGVYPVVFESYAVAELLFNVSCMLFKGDLCEEKRSPASGNLGQKMFSEKFSLTDDPFGVLRYPFDAEGVPKEKLPLIENGVLNTVCYNSHTAKKYGKKPTGHTWSGLFWGAYGESVPLNIIMNNGNVLLDEMTASVDRGIYVTRVHYVNIADPMTITLTGLTREGTFLIENGKISKPLKTARFTQNMIEVFNTLEAVSRESKFIMNDSFYGDRFPFGYQVPAIKVPAFNFTM